MAYPIPLNEFERLRECNNLRVFESAPLSELQALCEVAAHVAKTPVALVSLVGADDQKFAAKVGLPHLSGTSRDDAFCAHTIMSPEPLIVADATKDARFERNRLVEGDLHLRAYAGVPLETALNCRVGSLCVIDSRPRRFSRRQIDELSRLGLAVARLLAGHRSQAELLETLSDRSVKEQQLRHAARHDPLTDIPNVSHFRDLAEAAIRKLKPNCNGALLLIDLDRFKSINDRYGHAFGDRYLKAAARALQRSIRETDVVGRIGGDEFAVLLSRVHTSDDAMTVSDRIRSELRAEATALMCPELGRASIGIALTPLHAERYDELYKLADVALYRSKAKGRDGYSIYDPSMGRGEEPLADRQRLLDGIANKEFVPYFQPKIDLKSRVVTGYELLSRWHHPEKGILAPSEFAFAFDDAVAAPLLTRSVLREALAQFAGLPGRSMSPGRLAFNATTADLQDPSLVDDILAMAREFDFAPGDLTIEVLETVVMGARNERVYCSLERLRSAGMHVALDDFGVGYAGLQHLRSWPIDEVKIDRSFVTDSVQCPQDQLILKSVISLAHQLGLAVVAEGIETETQAHLLAALGCDTGQGYLFSTPLLASELGPLLDRHPTGQKRPAPLRLVGGT